MELITIKTFETITSLGIVKSYLESEDIECFVKDEFMGTVYAGMGVSSLSIKLQVRDSDVEKAIQLLIEGGYARPEDYEVDKTMLRLSKYYERIVDFFKRK
ncbi:putative signal transducing protein [Viscerimonas tarda]